MEVTKKDVLKHYLSSVFVYGMVLLLLFIMPAFNQNITNTKISYLTVLLIYYILYVVLAYPIFAKFKPQSILNSRNVVIVNYLKRQFKLVSVEEKISNISMSETEKQSFVILFIKAFFGSYCLSLLCNKYLVQLGYSIDFLRVMHEQMLSSVEASGFWSGIIQCVDDTADVWLGLMFTVTNFVFAFSYLTEAEFLKNKINYADTSFLGIFSCLMCYYPFVLLTEKIIPIAMKDVIPVDNDILRLTIYLLVLLVNFVAMIAILRLGTRSGNLTNRGVVTGFPYNIVRHPEYSMKIFYIILTIIPVYIVGNLSFLGNVVLTIGMLMWIMLFILRAVTEERNLIKDENYKNYIQKVKYRFIPFVV